MSTIYLDQWVYVELLRTEKHLSPEYPKYSAIYTELMESSRKGTNRFPLSSAHIHESIRRTKLTSRKELLKLIFKLSKFHTIGPWIQVIDLEVGNAILELCGFPPADLSRFVFGDELAHCFDIKAIAESGKVNLGKLNKVLPQEVVDQLRSALKDPELVSDAYSTDQELDYIKRLEKEYRDVVHKLEDLRKEECRHPNKKMRKNISEARFLIQFIEPRFTEIVFKLESELKPDLDFKEYVARKAFSSKQSAQAFLKSIPTAYVFHVLYDALSRNITRPIEPNDLLDLGSLAIAVPYCDVVVAEREWSNILNDRKIGELYNTRITHKIEDLASYLQ